MPQTESSWLVFYFWLIIIFNLRFLMLKKQFVYWKSKAYENWNSQNLLLTSWLHSFITNCQFHLQDSSVQIFELPISLLSLAFSFATKTFST